MGRCKMCGWKMPRFMEFRYRCTGCDKLHCDKHLDWRYGHKCPGAAEKFLKSRDNLSCQMPQITKNKVAFL